MSASTPAQQQSPDPNTTLIQLCVKALRAVAPEGMTTKDLAAALDKEVTGTPGFDGISSSILSSKLNAIFRRCHGDSASPTRAQLAELPLTRSQSAEVPRRLVYRYTPADNGDVPDTPSTPVEDTSSGDESVELNEPLTPKEDSLVDKSAYGPASKKRRVSENVSRETQYPTQPGTPPETFSKSSISKSQTEQGEEETSPSLHSSASKLAQGAHHDKALGARPKAVPVRRPRFSYGKTVGVNLYYDAVGLDAMSAALNLKQAQRSEGERPASKEASKEDASSDLDWSDFPSPELLGLHELDGFVC